MMSRPIFYRSNNQLVIVIHQVDQIMQAAISIFKMAANKSSFFVILFAYRVHLGPATDPGSTKDPSRVVSLCSGDPHY